MTAEPLRQRRHLLLTMLVALGFRYPADAEPLVITGLRQLLGGWPRIGRLAAGMARLGYDLQLTRYGEEGWRATFYVAGTAHSLTAAIGSAWERQPGRAVQRAAGGALKRAEG